MKQNITFRFDFDTNDPKVAHSLMKILLRKMEQLQEHCPEIHALEASVHTLAFDEERKEANIYFRCAGEEIRGQARAERWNDALLDAFDKASQLMRQKLLVY